jgi:CubicO group peptidase (beta-lactamase class C family)
LYGIALAEGKVPGVGTPVVDAFPEYPDLAKAAERRRIKMSDVLTMTMGLDWNEELPYNDPRNSEVAMEQSADRYRFVLGRPIVAKPGEKWQYSGGSTAILGRLIARGTGLPLLDYARQKLFGPLGITKVEWATSSNGEVRAASGLRMTARDLARVGQLVLQRGAWQGRAVVPEAWLSESLTPYTDSWLEMKYGYQWYMASAPNGPLNYIGHGLGGQRLTVSPARESVSVIFMGNYYQPDQIVRLNAVRNVINSAAR